MRTLGCTLLALTLIAGAATQAAAQTPVGVILGADNSVALIEKAGLTVPANLAEAARTGEPKRFFNHPHINAGRFFVAG